MSAMTLPLAARCCAGALLAAGLLSFRWEHSSADPTPACLPAGTDVERPVAAAAPVVRDQVLFEVWEGPFGISVGDLNGDGCDDVAVSNRRLHRDSRERANTVKVYAGPRGDVLWGVVGGPGVNDDASSERPT